MPRLSRVVFAGLPHHITQRGNRRDDVFFTDEDRLAYLDWLSVEEEAGRLDMLRKHVEKGLPCGTESFVARLGNQIGRILERRPQGRPRLEKEEKG